MQISCTMKATYWFKRLDIESGIYDIQITMTHSKKKMNISGVNIKKRIVLSSKVSLDGAQN